MKIRCTTALPPQALAQPSWENEPCPDREIFTVWYPDIANDPHSSHFYFRSSLEHLLCTRQDRKHTRGETESGVCRNSQPEQKREKSF